MIITRTPFRISFVGGGTDLKKYYQKENGRVLSTSINKFIYVIIKRQIGIVEYKYRINWSKVEFCNTIAEIEHPIVREALKMFEIDYPIEITTLSDIPGQTGLGSSSAFSVGLVHALHALKGEMVTKHVIATEAAHIEVNLLGRSMGKQDHYASAYGNLNVFTFCANEVVWVEPIFYRPEVKSSLEKKLMLFYTSIKRDASEVLKLQERQTQDKRSVLREMQNLVDPMRDILSNGSNLEKFGNILHDSWELKRSIIDEISSVDIDRYYQKARDVGAVGGKLLGAGGGGFLLFYVEEKYQEAVIDALSDLYFMPVRFDSSGTRVTYYDQS